MHQNIPRAGVRTGTVTYVASNSHSPLIIGSIISSARSLLHARLRYAICGVRFNHVQICLVCVVPCAITGGNTTTALSMFSSFPHNNSVQQYQVSPYRTCHFFTHTCPKFTTKITSLPTPGTFFVCWVRCQRPNAERETFRSSNDRMGDLSPQLAFRHRTTAVISFHIREDETVRREKKGGDSQMDGPLRRTSLPGGCRGGFCFL